MKIFVSWSGKASHSIALALQELLELIDNSIDVFVSSKELSKGSLWAAELSKALSDSELGIVVLTPTNLSSPWIHFESGALFKGLPASRVVPIVFDVPKGPPGDTPLALFQWIGAERDRMEQLFDQIYKGLPNDARIGQRQRRFRRGWPEFSRAIKTARADFPADFEVHQPKNQIVQLATTQQQLDSSGAGVHHVVHSAKELRVSGGTFKTFCDDARNLDHLADMVKRQHLVRLIFLDPGDEGIRMLARMRKDYSPHATVSKLREEVRSSIERLQDHLGRAAVDRIVRFNGALPRFGMCLSDRAVAITLYSFGHGASSPSLSMGAVDAESRTFCAALKKGFDDAWRSKLMKPLKRVKLGSGQ